VFPAGDAAVAAKAEAFLKTKYPGVFPHKTSNYIIIAWECWIKKTRTVDGVRELAFAGKKAFKDAVYRPLK